MGCLFDTTDESLAKKNDIHDERKSYTPLLVLIGEGRLVQGLETDLKKAKVGEKREIVIAPVDGYGERDTKLMQTESLQKIRRLNPDAQLFQGAEIEIEGKKHLLYPHQIRIIEKSKINATVLQSYYKGFYWLSEAAFKNQKVYIKHATKIEAGKKVSLFINT